MTWNKNKTSQQTYNYGCPISHRKETKDDFDPGYYPVNLPFIPGETDNKCAAYDLETEFEEILKGDSDE